MPEARMPWTRRLVTPPKDKSDRNGSVASTCANRHHAGLRSGEPRPNRPSSCQPRPSSCSASDSQHSADATGAPSTESSVRSEARQRALRRRRASAAHQWRGVYASLRRRLAEFTATVQLRRGRPHDHTRARTHQRRVLTSTPTALVAATLDRFAPCSRPHGGPIPRTARQ